MDAQTSKEPIQERDRKNFLIAFGDLRGETSVVKANQVFKALVDENVWYLVRTPRSMTVGDRLLIYQNGRGIRLSATVDAIADLVAGHQSILDASVRNRFHYKLALGNVRAFDPPVSIRGIVKELEFISNKIHWGTGLRSTPRTISDHDFDLLSSMPLSGRTDGVEVEP